MSVNVIISSKSFISNAATICCNRFPIFILHQFSVALHFATSIYGAYGQFIHPAFVPADQTLSVVLTCSRNYS
jgi:hypothetical protein